MRKLLFFSTLALFAVLSILVNGQAAEKVYKLRLAHATVGDTQDRIANEFVKLLGEMSKGRIDGKVYNASQLGDNEAMNQGVQSGSIEAHIEPSAFFAPYSKIFGIMNLPFLWKNSESSLRVANDPTVLKTFEESAAKVGVKIVSFYTFGPQHLARRSLSLRRCRRDSVPGVRPQSHAAWEVRRQRAERRLEIGRCLPASEACAGRARGEPVNRIALAFVFGLLHLDATRMHLRRQC